MEKLHISKKALEQWLAEMIKSGKHVYAPVRQGEQVEFKRIAAGDVVADGYVQTVQSAKRVAFPKAEVLFSYRKEGKDTVVKDVDAASVAETVLWKIRPCDALGFTMISGIFNWDYTDKLYNIRREKMTLVSFSCTTCDDSCFCTSVGGGPGCILGSDIQVTLLPDESAWVEVITPKGKALARTLKNAVPADDVDKSQYLADVPVRFASEAIQGKLKDAFESPIWKKQSERCLGCGACAFVCPTCACFDIQEDAHGSTGRRIRCWDSCGFSLFTQHTSGHNPRPTQSTRWRQRILHKFSYMPERLNGLGCTGCGRCSRACPVDMNILEHLISIANHE